MRIEIPAKVRNWHKRNLRNADDMAGTVAVVACPDATHYQAYGQIMVRTERGTMNINMTPTEFKELAARMTSCCEAFKEG